MKKKQTEEYDQYLEAFRLIAEMAESELNAIENFLYGKRANSYLKPIYESLNNASNYFDYNLKTISKNGKDEEGIHFLIDEAYIDKMANQVVKEKKSLDNVIKKYKDTDNSEKIIGLKKCQIYLQQIRSYCLLLNKEIYLLQKDTVENKKNNTLNDEKKKFRFKTTATKLGLTIVVGVTSVCTGSAKQSKEIVQNEEHENAIVLFIEKDENGKYKEPVIFTDYEGAITDVYKTDDLDKTTTSYMTNVGSNLVIDESGNYYCIDENAEEIKAPTKIYTSSEDVPTLKLTK